jgi:hypothetical protein
MEEIGNNKKCANLFTRGSHHNNITVIAIIHNLFHQQRLFCSISLSTRYFVLFESPRDTQQIHTFGRQIFPQHKNFISSAFNQVIKKAYGYLILDLHPQTPNTLRVYTGIFSDEVPRIFIPQSLDNN